MLRVLTAGAHTKRTADRLPLLLAGIRFVRETLPCEVVYACSQGSKRAASSKTWDPNPSSNPWGGRQVVRPAKQPPKGKKKGGTKQPQAGTPAAARKWAYERRKMANEKSGITIAVEGCCHGDLDKIYATLQAMEVKERRTIDLLICCGDFQAVRNNDDLECLACPPKYRDLKSFWRYYIGAAAAPFPTVFVGGNHEASNHLWELHNGGWVAPNIYFLGAAGVVNFAGVRIAGLSGIFNGRHYRQGHYERPPYTESTIRSAYHIRELDVYRLAQLQQPIDVFVSHDWPRGIARHGDLSGLLRAKSFLRQEIEANTLGSPPGEMLLQELRPRYWFAAHLHVKFAAVVKHASQPPRGRDTAVGSCGSSRGNIASTVQQSAVEAQSAARLAPGQQPQLVGKAKAAKLSAGGHAAEASGAASGSGAGGRVGARETRFLALDKCLPRRGFLQVLDFPEAKGPKHLCYDEEWLSVLRGTHHLLSLTPRPKQLPGMGGTRTGPSEADTAFVRAALADRGGATIPSNFVRTARGHDPKDPSMRRGRMPQSSPRNPQSEALLNLIGVSFNLDTNALPMPPPPGGNTAAGSSSAANPEEITLDEVIAVDPDEIDLDDIPFDTDQAEDVVDEGAAASAAAAVPNDVLKSYVVEAADTSAADQDANPEEIEIED